MIKLSKLKLHDYVRTPHGVGIYQGMVFSDGKHPRMIITWPKGTMAWDDVPTSPLPEPLSRDNRGSKRTLWAVMYPLDQIDEYEGN